MGSEFLEQNEKFYQVFRIWVTSEIKEARAIYVFEGIKFKHLVEEVNIKYSKSYVMYDYMVEVF